jgi:hypothetical protein
MGFLLGVLNVGHRPGSCEFFLLSSYSPLPPSGRLLGPSHLKFKENSNLKNLLKFYLKTCAELEVWSMDKVVPLNQIYQVWIPIILFLENGKVPFSIFEFGSLNRFWIIIWNSKTGWACSSASLPHPPAARVECRCWMPLDARCFAGLCPYRTPPRLDLKADTHLLPVLHHAWESSLACFPFSFPHEQRSHWVISLRRRQHHWWGCSSCCARPDLVEGPNPHLLPLLVV